MQKNKEKESFEGAEESLSLIIITREEKNKRFWRFVYRNRLKAALLSVLITFSFAIFPVILPSSREKGLDKAFLFLAGASGIISFNLILKLADHDA